MKKQHQTIQNMLGSLDHHTCRHLLGYCDYLKWESVCHFNLLTMVKLYEAYQTFKFPNNVLLKLNEKQYINTYESLKSLHNTNIPVRQNTKG